MNNVSGEAATSPSDVPPDAVSSTATGERPVGVKSALRVLTILEHFAESPRPATLAQITKKLDLPKSSCFALLETLRQAGYLYWLGKDSGYYPTRRWRDLGDAVARNDPILALTAPVLAKLRDEVAETAILAKRDGLEVLYLDVAEPAQILRFAAHAGERKPMHSASSGRAMLALLPETRRKSLVAQLERTRYSSSTLVEPAAIEAEILAGIARGWHVAIGEYKSDTTSISAGFTRGGEEYALVIGAPIHRVAERHAHIGALLAAYAQTLSSEESR